MTNMTDAPSTKYWILVWKDEWWDLHRRADGETRTFYSHDASNGRARQFLKNFREIELGDRVLGYVAGVGLVAELGVVKKAPSARGVVSSSAGLDVEFRKLRSLPRIVPLGELRQDAQARAISAVRLNLTGSLFALTSDEWLAMAALIEKPVTSAAQLRGEPSLPASSGAPRRSPATNGDEAMNALKPVRRSSRIPQMTSAELGRVAEIFLGAPLTGEFALQRFRFDHYCEVLRVAVEYDGPEHYSEVHHIERDTRKDALCRDEQIMLKRWPYYLQLTRDVAKWFWAEHYTDEKCQEAIRVVYETADESQILAPGLHNSKNTPANYVERGRARFLAELEAAPVSVRSQVVRSFQIYQQRLGVDRHWLLLPEGDPRFVALMQHVPHEAHLNCYFPAVNMSPGVAPLQA